MSSLESRRDKDPNTKEQGAKLCVTRSKWSKIFQNESVVTQERNEVISSQACFRHGRALPQRLDRCYVYITAMLIHFHENNEPQDFEPVANVLAGSTTEAKNKESQATSSKPSTQNVGLVLSGGLPTIPADIFTKIKINHYVELSELLPEKIQDSILYPEGKKEGPSN